jgi:DNA-binding transcriptional ArsR family regulator
MRARTQLAAATDSHLHLTDTAVDAAAATFRLLGDPTRLRLMWALRESEMDVTRLAGVVGAARPAVSQHLARLRAAGLVSARKVGQRVVYRAPDPRVPSLLASALNQDPEPR